MSTETQKPDLNVTGFPGPWGIWKMGNELVITCTGRKERHSNEGAHVARVSLPSEQGMQWEGMCWANARKVAAAPDMLEALQEIVRIHENIWSPTQADRIANIARAAIAIAEGKA
jgi:hypothetical protein